MSRQNRPFNSQQPFREYIGCPLSPTLPQSSSTLYFVTLNFIWIPIASNSTSKYLST